MRLTIGVRSVLRCDSLNQRLYYLHLEGAHQYNGMWRHIQEYIDEQINRSLSQRNTLRTPIVRHILYDVPLHNMTCCHSTILIQGIH